MSYHLSFIMDGNRRWAFQNNLDYQKAYMKGAFTFEMCVRYVQKSLCFDVVSFFCFSGENLRRDASELKLLWRLFEGFDFSFLDKKKVYLKFVGCLEQLPPPILEIANYWENEFNCLQAVKTIYLFVNYGGCQDIAQGLKRAQKQLVVSEESLKSNLLSKEVPPIDCLVRTGKEKRLSNFDLWDMDRAELFFLDCLWPHLEEKDLIQIESSFLEKKKNT